MNFRLSPLLALLMICLSGCETYQQIDGGRFIVYTPNTVPNDVFVYADQSEERQMRFRHEVSQSEYDSGYIQLPPLWLESEGFIKQRIAPTTITAKQFDQLATPRFAYPGGGIRRRDLCADIDSADKITLVKDPHYAGPIGPAKNTIVLTVNSEPRGGRVYENGEYIGIAPLTMTYTIGEAHYKQGKIVCKPIIVVHDGRLPCRQDPIIDIDPEWRYQQKTAFKAATLFVLASDPNYRPPVVVQIPPQNNTSHVTIKQDKDALDALLQIGQISTMIKAIRATP